MEDSGPLYHSGFSKVYKITSVGKVLKSSKRFGSEPTARCYEVCGKGCFQYEMHSALTVNTNNVKSVTCKFNNKIGNLCYSCFLNVNTITLRSFSSLPLSDMNSVVLKLKPGAKIQTVETVFHFKRGSNVSMSSKMITS